MNIPDDGTVLVVNRTFSRCARCNHVLDTEADESWQTSTHCGQCGKVFVAFGSDYNLPARFAKLVEAERTDLPWLNYGWSIG